MYLHLFCSFLQIYLLLYHQQHFEIYLDNHLSYMLEQIYTNLETFFEYQSFDFFQNYFQKNILIIIKYIDYLVYQNNKSIFDDYMGAILKLYNLKIISFEDSNQFIKLIVDRESAIKNFKEKILENKFLRIDITKPKEKWKIEKMN